MKRLFVPCAVFLGVLFLMASVVACEELREVPSHDPGIIVFQTGTPAITLGLCIVLVLLGLGGVVAGIWQFWVYARDFVKKSNKLKQFGWLLV